MGPAAIVFPTGRKPTFLLSSANPLETRFLREAKEAGCKTLGGLAMLISQAAEQFKLWTGVDAARDVMLDAASRAFSNA